MPARARAHHRRRGRAREGADRRSAVLTTLATIGYEGETLDRVIGTLRDARTKLLIDVRAVPRSRKPGFSKGQLAAGLDAAGIGYVHLVALGTPKAGRDAVRSGHPEVMRRLFADHMTGDEPQAALAEATGLAVRDGACLLCFERDHLHCHRAIVAEMIATQSGIVVEHLATPARTQMIALASN